MRTHTSKHTCILCVCVFLTDFDPPLNVFHLWFASTPEVLKKLKKQTNKIQKFKSALLLLSIRGIQMTSWTHQHPLLLSLHRKTPFLFPLSIPPHHSVRLPNTTTLLIQSSLFPPSHAPFFSRPLRAIMKLIACLMNSPWTWNSRLLAV